MDVEPIAKRRRLNSVELEAEAFGIGPDRAWQQSHSQEALLQVHHISIPSENTFNVKTGHSYNASTHSGREAAAETTSEYRLGHVQQPNIVPRHKSLSGLDQVCHAQEEAACNGVRSVASGVGELGTSGAHDANGGRRDAREDGEICFGMVCHPLHVRPTDSSEAH